MATGKKNKPDEPLRPISVTAIESPVTPSHANTSVIPGKVELVQVDASGNEIGASFLISERQYNKTFVNNPQFKLKKNTKQQ